MGNIVYGNVTLDIVTMKNAYKDPFIVADVGRNTVSGVNYYTDRIDRVARLFVKFSLFKKLAPNPHIYNQRI